MGPNDRPAAATRWTWMAWSAAALMTLVVSVAILRNPVQVTDSLVPILRVQDGSSGQVFMSKIGGAGFLRPLYWVQIKLLLDGSRGRYAIAYKAFHVLCVALLFFFFALAARVRTKDDAAAFAFALVVLTGMHTFLGMVWEAYPVNHYLEIAVFCVAAIVLCQSRGGVVADIVAALLFVVASLTLDSGILVWVVIAAGRLVGLRGVSWRGVAMTTALLAAYMVLRFEVFQIGSPLVGERAVGFGFSRIEPAEIESRFVATGHLYYFYLYNVVSAFVSVFLSEPISGRWMLTQRIIDGGIDPMVATSLISTLVATGLIVRFAIVRRRDWAARQFNHGDQIVLVCVAVALGNAVMCFSYVKDEIMSTAGVFYALAAFSGMRHALATWAAARTRTAAGTALVVVLFAGSAAWTIRTTGSQYQMLRIGTVDRYEWAHVDEWLAQQNQTPTTAQGARLVRDLRTDAMRTRPLSVLFVPRWAVRWFIPE
jgi:hypothetical protein